MTNLFLGLVDIFSAYYAQEGSQNAYGLSSRREGAPSYFLKDFCIKVADLSVLFLAFL